MRIRTRLAFLLAVALAAFSLALGALRWSNAREARLMLASISSERNELLDRLLDLIGQPLQQLVNDYSHWDEMVAFTASGNPAWAKVNIETTLSDMNVCAAWVFKPDGTPVYGMSRLPNIPALPFPLSATDLAALTSTERFPHFYAGTPAGPIELRGAPILSTSDNRRTSTPRGWLFAARLWDEESLNTLGKLTESDVSLTAVGEEPAGAEASSHSLKLHRELRDWRGRGLLSLHLHQHPTALERLMEDNRIDNLIFIFFGLSIIVLVTLTVHLWIARPLRTLNEGLARRDSAAIKSLATATTEFGKLARLVETSFAEHAALTREIDERRRAETALRTSESSLRQALDVQGRLGRDLHDGVIQSIYAAGLGLESLRPLIQSNPPAAQQRLDQVRKSLNETIWEMRNFIAGLEPRESQKESFSQILTNLAKTMQTVWPVRIALSIDPSLVEALSPKQEVQALHLTREALSNALRHGHAASVNISFRREGGDVILEIRDDGEGFDPVQRAGTGRGLANAIARAEDMGATLTLESAPGKGTRVLLRFASSLG